MHRKRLEKAFPSQLGEKGANPDLCFRGRDLFSRRTREINAKIFFLRKMLKHANHVLTFKDGFYARRMNRMIKKSEGAIREWCSPISVENACFANENVRGLISSLFFFFFFSCPGVVREKARLSYRNRQVDKGRKTLTSTTTTRTMALSVRGLPKLSVSPA